MTHGSIRIKPIAAMSGHMAAKGPPPPPPPAGQPDDGFQGWEEQLTLRHASWDAYRYDSARWSPFTAFYAAQCLQADAKSSASGKHAPFHLDLARPILSENEVKRGYYS